MFSAINVIDNFFKNPEQIVHLANNQQYYIFKDNPRYLRDEKKIFYNGRRTLFLKDTLKKNVVENLNDEILKNLFESTIRKESQIEITADISCLFHSLFEDDVYDINNAHKDSVIFAGVVYLNKNLESNNHGTIIDGKVIPYKFNRLVFYRADLLHCPLNGFGNDIKDSRMTLNIFVNKIKLSVKGTVIKNIQ
jgi:hypothetical protein